jgi:hypothetical protein
LGLHVVAFRLLAFRLGLAIVVLDNVEELLDLPSEEGSVPRSIG